MSQKFCKFLLVKFQILSTLPNDDQAINNNYEPHNRLGQVNNALTKKPNIDLKSLKTLPLEKDHTGIPFKAVEIYSDSHGRQISSIMKEVLHNKKEIRGMCKPNAKLANILPDLSKMEDSSDTCLIIIAG